jgi:prepilin-type N-terminal cleavage/methylation domain-containing protein
MNPVIKPNNRKYGFTLTELLVVIVIVAALAVITSMMVLRMKKSANQAVTTANLRQIGLALIAYTVDKGRFPSLNGDPVWDRAIIANLGYESPLPGSSPINRSAYPTLENSAKIFTTPEDTEKRDPAFYARSFAIVPWTTNNSNGTWFRGWKDRPFNVGVPYSVLNAPEKAAMVVQGHHGIGGGTANYLGSGSHAYKDMGGPVKTLGTTQQVLFADGHIEKVSNRITNAEFVAKYWPGTIGNVN